MRRAGRRALGCGEMKSVAIKCKNTPENAAPKACLLEREFTTGFEQTNEYHKMVYR
jgi:hypothetical protein